MTKTKMSLFDVKACGSKCVINGKWLTKENKKYKTRCKHIVTRPLLYVQKHLVPETPSEGLKTFWPDRETNSKTTCLLICEVPPQIGVVSVWRGPTESAPPRAVCGQEGRTSPQNEGWCF